MATSNNILRSVVDDIRQRWKRRALVRGVALTCVIALVIGFVFLLALTNVVVANSALIAASVVALLIVGGVVWQYVVRPLRNQPTDQQIALFVEEQIPDLEDRFNAAVEVNDNAQSVSRSALIERLLEDAGKQARRIRPDTLLDRRREQWLSYGAGALLLVFLLFGYSVRDKISFSDGKIALTALTVAQPEMSITPGSVEIEKGASQEIIARFRSDSDDDVVLVWKEGEEEWRRDVMIRGGVGEPVFLFELEDLQQETQYFIEQGDLRSDPFTLSLYEFPDVSSIAVRVAYPSYTGLGSQTDEDTGDISALRGSRATISIGTIGTTQTAELVYSDGEEVSFDAADDGTFAVSVPVREDDYYTIKLTDARNKQNKFPEEYRIEALDDLEPTVNVTDPRRDLRANSIEEVLIAANATDDIGLKSLSLIYSVNASDEKAISLTDNLTKRTKEADGDYLFFLEDYSLEAGDVISYYVQVEDYLERNAPIATDMYFIEVVPFDNKFTQANNAGGGGGGGGEQSGIVISQQQIIAATWKLIREQGKMAADDRDSALKALVTAQANLKQNIEKRISSTAFSLELRASDEQQKIVEFLRNSIREMDRAIDVLESDDLKGALTPERLALNQLLKADAMNREQQVQANRQQGGGGGGGGSAQDRITELMDLELDISKDKYETQQQRQQGGGDQADSSVDDALNKVRDLARKQEELAQRSQENNIEGEDKKRFIETLKRDQDEIKQQTEQLSNALNQLESKDGNKSGGRQMQKQLDRVSENMEKSERALRKGDVDEAMTHQRRALNELEELQDQLTMKSTDDARSKVRQLADEFDQFRAQEKRLADDIDRASSDARQRGNQGLQAADQKTAADLREKREQMIENLDRLTDRASAVEKNIRDDDPALAGAIRNMLQQIRRDGLEKNMRDSREALLQNWLEYADRKEDMIMETVDQLDEQRRAFDGTLPVTDEERLARSMQDLKDLRSQLEDIEQEATLARGENPGGQPGESGGEAEGQGAEGQQGNGEQGESGQAQADGQGGGGQGQGRSGAREARTAQARLERQVERARETLERLEQSMEGSAEGQRQAEQIRSFLNRAEGTGVKLEGQAAKDFFNARAYDPLSKLEETIIRQLDFAQLEKKLYGAKRSEVPAEYQELVDKYYESLSKKN